MAYKQSKDCYRTETFRLGTSSVVCQWRLVTVPTATEVARPFRTLNLLLSSSPLEKNGVTINGHASDVTNTAMDATDTSIDILLRHLAKQHNTAKVALKVILAPHGGYVCTSNIFNVRIQLSDLVQDVIPLATWDQELEPMLLPHGTSLLELLGSSPGAIIARNSGFHDDAVLERLEEHLNERLEFDWILPNKPAPRTVAVIAGRSMCEPERGIYWSQGYFEAAHALGISMIVLDNAGHWLEGPEFAHLRREFIAIHLSASDTEALPQT